VCERHNYRPRLQALFEDVWAELYNLEVRLMLHMALFAGPIAPRYLAAAPMTFGLLQEALADAILLAVHRLIEPGAQRGRRTASVETLLAHLPPDAAPLRRELRKTLKEIRRACAVLADVRHRVIAHRDYAVVMEEAAAPERVPYQSLGVALQGCARILTAIARQCGLTPAAYDPGEVALVDVNEVIRRLQSEPAVDPGGVTSEAE